MNSADSLVGVTAANADKRFSAATVLANMLGNSSGILTANGSGGLGVAVAGTDYLTPSGNGHALTGITASQVSAEPAITAGTTSQYWRGDKSFQTLNQAAVAGLTTASSPTFAGLTVGSLTGLLKAASGVVTTATAVTDYALTLVPTAVKTGAYNAAANDFIPCDTTSAGFTVTLPTAPADGTGIGVKHVVQGGTNVVTISAGGSDVFNKAGGGTSLTLGSQNRSVRLQYKASSAIWYVLTNDLGTILTTDLPSSVVLTSGSYSNPAWITSISGGIVSGNISGNAANVTGTVAIATGGTGQTSAGPAFNALSPLTTLGDTLYASGTNTSTRLAGNTTTTRKFYRQTGNGSASAAPAWDTIVNADVPAAGSSGQVQYNLSNAFAGANSLSIGSSGETVFGSMAGPTVSGTGQTWNDSTQKVLSSTSAGVAFQTGGIMWQGLGAANSVSNSNSMTSLLSGFPSTVGTLTLPASGLLAGKQIRRDFLFSINSTGSPTITFAEYLGNTQISQSAATTVSGLNTVGIVGDSRSGGLQIQVANGANSKAIGLLTLGISGVGNVLMPSGASGNANLAPAQVTVDVGNSAAYDLRCQWSAANSANNIVCRSATLHIDG